MLASSNNFTVILPGCNRTQVVSRFHLDKKYINPNVSYPSWNLIGTFH